MMIPNLTYKTTGMQVDSETNTTSTPDKMLQASRNFTCYKLQGLHQVNSSQET